MNLFFKGVEVMCDTTHAPGLQLVQSIPTKQLVANLSDSCFVILSLANSLRVCFSFSLTLKERNCQFKKQHTFFLQDPLQQHSNLWSEKWKAKNLEKDMKMSMNSKILLLDPLILFVLNLLKTSARHGKVWLVGSGKKSLKHLY